MLIGLIAPGLGLFGETWRIELAPSTFFHRVDDADVAIGDGLGGRCLFGGVDNGVCCPES